MEKDLSDFGVCEGGECEVNFTGTIDPEWVEFDAKVEARKEKIRAALNGAGKHPRLPERRGIKDLINVTPYEEEAINSILAWIDPDDIFGFLEDANMRDRITFIAGFVVGRSI